MIPIIVMGVVLELGKLGATLFLHREWKRAPILIRFYLISAVFTLIIINSIGIYGFLSKGHISQEITNQTQSSQVEITQNQIDTENLFIDDLKKQIDQIDKSLSKLTDQGKAQTALREAVSQRKQRDALVAQETEHIKKIADLKTQKITQDSNNKRLEADFGPLAYIAAEIYGKPSQEQLEATVRWIITILVFVFDPLALVLLMAAQFSLTKRKKDLTGLNEKDIMMIGDDFFKKD